MVSKKNFKAEFGGKERTFWLGMGFLGMFLKETKTTVETLDKALSDNPFEMIPAMVYCSLMYGYKRAKADLDFTKFEVVEWLDDAGGVSGDFVINFLDEFGEAMNDPSKGKERVNLKKGQKAAQKKTVASR